eukprot:7336829-Prymnesium_polylepis.1
MPRGLRHCGRPLGPRGPRPRRSAPPSASPVHALASAAKPPRAADAQLGAPSPGDACEGGARPHCP